MAEDVSALTGSLHHYATRTSPDRGAHAASRAVKRRRGASLDSRRSRSRADFLLRRFINFTRAEHLLKAACERQEGTRRGAAAALRSALEMSKLSAEGDCGGVCVRACVAQYRLFFRNCVRAHFHLAAATAPNLPLDLLHRIETSYSQAAA